jgi:hypothetical protein
MNRFKLSGVSRIKVLSSAMVLAAMLGILLVSLQPASACGCTQQDCPGCCGNFGCYSLGQTECEAGGTKVICESDHQMHFVCQLCC